MGVLLPVMYAALSLGLTFHLPSYRQGNELVFGDLHDKSEMEEKEEILSLYKVINTPKDVRDFVRVEPRYAIQTKLDNFDTVVSSIIRSSVVSRETTVEIMLGTRYIKGIEKIPAGQKVLHPWESKEHTEVGTHYIKSFSRGGYFLTSIVFPCKTVEQKEKVMKAVLNNLKNTGTLDKSFIDKMEKIKEELGNDYVNYRFGSINCIGCGILFLNNLEQVLDVALNLPDKLKKVQHSKGAMLIMELEELSSISSHFPAYKENSKIVEKLDEIDQMYDDVMIARKEFISTEFLWSIDLTKDDEKEVNQFYNKIEKCRREFLHTLVNLDITPSASSSQLDDVYKEYGSTEDYQKYQKQFIALRNKIKKNLSK